MPSLRRLVYIYIIGGVLVSIAVLKSLPSPVYAHPLDVSYTDIHILHDFNNKPLLNNTAVAEVYLPWMEASLIAGRYENIASPEAKMLPKYHKSYTQYLEKKLSLSNNGKPCSALYGLPPEQPENEILFGRGVMIPVRYQCPSKLKSVTVFNSIFVDEFPVQQNFVNIYNGPEMAVKGALLTLQSQDFTFEADKLAQPPATRSSYGGEQSWLDTLSQGFLDAHATSLPTAIGLVFLLGLLHTLEVGHSKSVLTSFIIQKKARLKDGFLFAAIFTVTHIADIVVLGLLLLLTNSFIDVFSRLSYLQTFSLYALLFVALYMFLRNLSIYLKHLIFPVSDAKAHGHTHTVDVKDIRKQLILGFITGLSPCLFGWSIFMVILTTKTIWVVFPIILSFGMGIFIALSLIVIIVGKFKIRLMNKFQFIGDISPIISSLLLVIFAFTALL